MLGGEDSEPEGMQPSTLNGATSLELMGKRTRAEAGGLSDFSLPAGPPGYPSLPLFNSGTAFMVRCSPKAGMLSRSSISPLEGQVAVRIFKSDHCLTFAQADARQELVTALLGAISNASKPSGRYHEGVVYFDTRAKQWWQ